MAPLAAVRDHLAGWCPRLKTFEKGLTWRSSNVNIKHKMVSDLNYIDLFAGCGGLSWGLMRSGWKGVFAVEKDAFAFATLKHNLIKRKKHFQWPAWFPIEAHDINEVLSN